MLLNVIIYRRIEPKKRNKTIQNTNKSHDRSHTEYIDFVYLSNYLEYFVVMVGLFVHKH